MSWHKMHIEYLVNDLLPRLDKYQADDESRLAALRIPFNLDRLTYADHWYFGCKNCSYINNPDYNWHEEHWQMQNQHLFLLPKRNFAKGRCAAVIWISTQPLYPVVHSGQFIPPEWRIDSQRKRSFACLVDVYGNCSVTTLAQTKLDYAKQNIFYASQKYFDLALPISTGLDLQRTVRPQKLPCPFQGPL